MKQVNKLSVLYRDRKIWVRNIEMLFNPELFIQQ